MVNLAAFYDGDDDRRVRAAWVDDFRAALQQGSPVAYVNFLGDEGEACPRGLPRGHQGRLAAVKRQHDPTNVFRRNQNVPPARP